MAIGWASPSQAQLEDDDAGFGPLPDYVGVRVIRDRRSYRPGQTAKLTLELDLHPDVHVNLDPRVPEAGMDDGKPFSKAPKIEWTAVPTGVEVSPTRWPKPLRRNYSFSMGRRLPVYEGLTRVRVDVRIPKEQPAGLLVLRGVLHAQGSTELGCLPPQEDDLVVELPVRSRRRAR